jgi:hypothetical protein
MGDRVNVRECIKVNDETIERKIDSSADIGTGDTLSQLDWHQYQLACIVARNVPSWNSEYCMPLGVR